MKHRPHHADDTAASPPAQEDQDYTTRAEHALDLAIGTDHPCQDHTGCDIARARAEGYLHTAAWLLIGATETPTVDQVVAQYQINLYPFPSDLDNWRTFTTQYGVTCPACGHHDYDDDDWTPDRCGNCGNPHPQTTTPDHTDRDRRACMDHQTITDTPLAYETGFAAYARELAQAVCQALGGDTWHAEGRTPSWPSDAVNQHSEITIVVDRSRIVVTQTQPAGTNSRQRWTITVNGQPIPHRVFPGELPHTAASVARSVWRHINAVGVDPCDRLLCKQPATVATWGASTCRAHAR